jgi:methyl-accepting chemotaxis protein
LKQRIKITELLFIGFLLVILAMTGVGYLSITLSQNVLKEKFGENLVDVSAEVLNKIDREINYRIEESLLMSQDSLLHQAVLASNKEFEELSSIALYLDEKEVEWVSAPQEVITPFMQELINNQASQELRKRIDFYHGLNDYKVFGEIFVTNKYGANAVQTGKTSDYKQDDEEWWQSAKNYGKYIREVEYDQSSNVYSTDIAIRVDDKKGDFIGVMKVVFNIEGLIDIVRESRIITSGQPEFKLINGDGRIIYSTENDSILKNVSKEPFFIRAKQGGTYFTTKEIKHSGEERLYAISKSVGYRNFPGLNWSLVLEHKTEGIFSPIFRLRQSLMIIVLITIIISFFVTLFISRLISTPLQFITKQIDEISRGNLDIDLKKESKIKEILFLSESLIRILASLKLAVLRKESAEEKTIIEKKRFEELQEQNINLVKKSIELAESRKIKEDLNINSKKT